MANTPLHSFLQDMIHEKSGPSGGSAEVVIIVDNASPTVTRKQSRKTEKHVLDIDHNRRNPQSTTNDTAGTPLAPDSPVPAPKQSVTPEMVYTKRLSKGPKRLPHDTTAHMK